MIISTGIRHPQMQFQHLLLKDSRGQSPMTAFAVDRRRRWNTAPRRWRCHVLILIGEAIDRESCDVNCVSTAGRVFRELALSKSHSSGISHWLNRSYS